MLNEYDLSETFLMQNGCNHWKGVVKRCFLSILIQC